MAEHVSAAISVNAITKRFAENAVVGPATLEIGSGALMSLLGPSGCGKTTLLRMIAGLEKPDSGTLTISGTDVTQVSPEKRDVGMIFQNHALFPHLSVYENVAFGLKVRKAPRHDILKAVMNALELVGLENLHNRVPKELSGGQQQRVAIARALVVRPSVLLLDEPFASLDSKLRVRMREEFREIQSSFGVTSIFVTHDKAEALAISDRVAVMSNGKVEQTASPEAIYNRPDTDFVAGFVANSNVIFGKVIQYDSGATFKADTGLKLVLNAASCSDHGHNRAAVAIHPENVEVHDSSLEAVNTFDAEITKVSYTGSSNEISLRLNHFPVTLHALSRSNSTAPVDLVGQKVSVTLPSEHLLSVSRSESV